MKNNGMVEVFKTNVNDPLHALWILNVLSYELPGARINFDLQDCDRILRVEGRDLRPELIMALLGKEGFDCVCLE